jgi:flagellar hook-basal body complex protein FliE
METIGAIGYKPELTGVGGIGGSKKPAALDALTDQGALRDRGFSDAISAALEQVSAQQAAGTRLSREFQMENPNVSLEETIIAMQKASLGFQATVQVRNKLVQAYNDLMNMNV